MTRIAQFGIVLVVFGIVVCAWLLQQLLVATLVKEGFQVEAEERMTPEAFSYNLLQSVKGPIRRLSAQLLDLGAWKERWDLAQLTPIELARRNLGAQ
jgi:hypothetical protein